MAKIRGGSGGLAAARKSKTATPAKKKPAGKAAKPPTKSSAKPSARPPAKVRVKPVPQAAPPLRRSTYADAVILYERGLQALQAKRYKDAADALRRVIAEFPEEIELHERSQLYIRVCERLMAPPDTTPKTPEELVYAATLAVNAGALDRAVALLTAALQQQRDHDAAEYMLGVVLAAKGDDQGALIHLGRAVDLNPENRELLRQEPDLEALRQTDGFRAMLAAARRDRRNALRARR